MTETAQRLVDMIQARLNNRLETLSALASGAFDSGIPDDVKKIREIEAAKIRAVMEEQKDLIQIIKMLYPAHANAKPTTKPGGAKKSKDKGQQG